jgi:hypothetical protein
MPDRRAREVGLQLTFIETYTACVGESYGRDQLGATGSEVVIVCDAFAVVLAGVCGRVDGELPLTSGAIRRVTFGSDLLPKHGKVRCRRNYLSAVSGFVAEANNTASFLVLHVVPV